MTDLKNKASLCEFSTLKDSLIRDRIVCGIRSDEVRARLLRDPHLTLVKAIDACRVAETSQTQLKGLTEEKPIDFSKREEILSLDRILQRMEQHNNLIDSSHARIRHKHTSVKDVDILDHEKKKCPAFGKKCRNCSKLNHFAKMCKRQKVHALDGTNQNDDSDWEYEQYFVKSIENDLTQEKDWKIVVEISGKKLEMKLDTGSQVNVLPFKIYNRLSSSPLRKSRCRLISYSGHKLNTIGKATLLVGTREKFTPVEFQVVDHKSQPVLGLQTCLDLQLIKRMYTVNTEDPNQLLNEYKDVFEGLGCLPGDYNIQLQDDAKPVIHPPRKIPFGQRSKKR